MARVFLSYSRRDEPFVDRLAAGLAERGVDVVRDVSDLMAAAEWRKQLEQMVATSDTVVFVVSPDSIASPECAWEIGLVESLNKRLAPVVWRSVQNDRLPHGISKLQYVDFSGSRDFEVALATLVEAIDTDIDWLAEHTRLGEMARRWDRERRPASGLLRGAALDAAERWVVQQPKAAPQPTAVHHEFIATSRRGASQRLRNWIVGSLGVAVLSVGLAVAAYFARLEAISQAEEAERQKSAAVSAQQLAQENESKAVTAQRQAEDAQRLEAQQRRAAQDNLAGQGRLLAQISEEQARAGNSEVAINLALKALPRDLANPDRQVVDDALVSLFYAVDQDRRLMTLEGHGNGVMHAAYSPDGRRILTASSDKSARLWDAATGELIREMVGAEDAVMHGAFSPDGSLVATTSGPIARVWDGRTGRPRFLLQGHTKNVQRIAFSPDGKRIVTGAWDNTARIWDAATGEQLYVLEGATWGQQTSVAGYGVADPIVAAVMQAQTQIFGGMDLVAVSPDGRTVATAGRADPEGVVRLWGMATGKLERVLRGPTLSMSLSFLDLVFSPDGSRVAAALGDNTARVWSTASGRQVLVLKDHTNSVNSVRFSADGQRIVTGAMDGSARIWSAASGKTLVAIHGHTDWVNAAEISPNGELVLTASSDNGLKLWNATSGALVADLVGHKERVLGAMFSPDGRTVLSASRDKTARVWMTSIGAPAARLEQPPEDKDRSSRYISERSVVASPDGQRLFVSSTSTDRSGALIDARSGAVLAEVDGQAGMFVDQGRALLTYSSEGGALRSWSPDDGRLLHSFPGAGVLTDPQRRRLASRSGVTLTVSDLATGQSIAQLEAEHDISAAVMTDDAAHVVTAGGTSLELWQVAGARRTARLGGLDGKPERLVLAARGGRVAAVSDTGAIGMWAVPDGRAIPLQRDPREEFTEAQFSGDGTLLRGTRRDGSVALWRSDDGRSVLSLARIPFAGATVVTSNLVELEPEPDDTAPANAFRAQGKRSRWSGRFGGRATSISSVLTQDRLLLLTTEGELWRVGVDGVAKTNLSRLDAACSGSVGGAMLGARHRHLIARTDKATCVVDIARGGARTLADGDAEDSYAAPQALDAAEQRLLGVRRAFVGLWDLATGKLLARMPKREREGWSSEAEGLAMARSGTRAVWAAEGAAHLWDAAVGKEIAVLRPAASTVKSVRFIEESGLVLTTHGDGELGFWRAEDGAILGTHAHPDGRSPDDGSSSNEDRNPLRVVGDGNLVLAAPASGVQETGGMLWEASTGRLVETGVVDVDRQGRRFVMRKRKKGEGFGSSGTRYLRVIDRPSNSVLLEIADTERDSLSSRDGEKGPWVDPTGARVAVAEKDRRMRLWSLAKGTVIATLARHVAPITSVAFDRTSGAVASAARDRVVRVWDKTPGEAPARTLDGLEAVPSKLVFDPGGRFLAALLENGAVAIWDTTTWSRADLSLPGQRPSSGMSLSPDGARLMLHDRETTAIWRTSDRKLLAEIKTESYDTPRFSGSGNVIVAGSGDRLTAYDVVRGTSFAFGDGEQLLDMSDRHALVAADDGRTLLYDVAGGGRAIAIAGLPSPAASGHFASDGNRLVLALKSGAVALLDPARPDVARVAGLPFASPEFLFSADARQLAIWGNSSTAMVLDAFTGEVITRLSGHTSKVDRVAFAEDGQHVLTKTGENWIVWHRATGARLGQLKSGSYGDEVQFVATAHGLRAIVPEYAAPELWDPVAGSRIVELKPPEGSIEDDRETNDRFRLSRDDNSLVALSHDGARLMFVSRDQVHCWDVATAKRTASTSQGAAGIDKLVTVSRDRAVSISESGIAALWSMTSCAVVAELKHAVSAIGDVIAAPDGSTLVTLAPSSSGNREVPRDPVLWDASTGRRIALLEGHGNSLQATRYSPDSRYVLTVPANGTTWLWRASDGKFQRALGRHNDSVAVVAFSGDGVRLATAAGDSSVEVTEVETGRRLIETRATGDRVAGLAVNQNGRRVAVGNAGGTFVVIDIASQRKLLERRAAGGRLRQLIFTGPRDDVLAIHSGGKGTLFRLAPSGFVLNPVWQELIDYAGIRDRPDSEAAAPAASDSGTTRSAGQAGSPSDTCDRLAADPYDEQRTAPPVAARQIEAATAVEACTQAVSVAPEIARLRHQLARALRTADRKGEAERTLRTAVADGYAASSLALATWLLAGQEPAAASEADKLLQAAADAGNAEALNLLGLQLWRRASSAADWRLAARLLREAARAKSAAAHENLATILSAWPDDASASAERLYHLLRAAELHKASGASARSAALSTRAQALSRTLPYAEAAAAARKLRLETAGK